MTTAVVTGAGRGIGLAIARGLADAGHTVVLTDVDESAVQHAASAVGRGAVGITQDVRDAASHRSVAATASELGELRVWVNNAGILLAGRAWDHDDADLSRILEVNVRGVMAGTAAAINAMGSAGGAILNVASLSAFMPVPGMALYAATKAAVLSYSTSAEGELRGAPSAGRSISTRVPASRASPGCTVWANAVRPGADVAILQEET